jgi:hypothetical protein
MQHNEVVFRDNPLEVDTLTRILVCHSPKIVDERLLSIPYARIVLNIGFPNVLLHRLLRFAMVEHEVVEGGKSLFISPALVVHLASEEVIPSFLFALGGCVCGASCMATELHITLLTSEIS